MRGEWCNRSAGRPLGATPVCRSCQRRLRLLSRCQRHVSHGPRARTRRHGDGGPTAVLARLPAELRHDAVSRPTLTVAMLLAGLCGAAHRLQVSMRAMKRPPSAPDGCRRCGSNGRLCRLFETEAGALEHAWRGRTPVRTRPHTLVACFVQACDYYAPGWRGPPPHVWRCAGYKCQGSPLSGQ